MSEPCVAFRSLFFLTLFPTKHRLKKRTRRDEEMHTDGLFYWKRDERTGTVRACWSYKLVSYYAIFLLFFLSFISLCIEIYNAKA